LDLSRVRKSVVLEGGNDATTRSPVHPTAIPSRDSLPGSAARPATVSNVRS